MKLRIWGCRGSIASPGPDTLRYGGNTTCLELTLSDGTVIVLDAGSGIRTLGEKLAAEGVEDVNLLLTHLHLDHLEGLPFFQPMWQPGTRVNVWGPQSPVRGLEENIARYMSPPLFPVQLSEVPAQCRFHNVPEQQWEIGPATVYALPVEHPGPTVGYRIEADGFTLAFIPDHEPVLGGDLTGLPTDWISGYCLAVDADLLFHDAQYSAAEYSAHIGWGHSSLQTAVSFTRTTGARKLVMFHHDPGHTDDQLEEMVAEAGEIWDGEADHRPILAAEGMEMNLG
ncbi:MAG: MBL fold metallo-hydrolase [Actinomycetota bacterium]